MFKNKNIITVVPQFLKSKSKNVITKNMSIVPLLVEMGSCPRGAREAFLGTPTWEDKG